MGRSQTGTNHLINGTQRSQLTPASQPTRAHESARVARAAGESSIPGAASVGVGVGALAAIASLIPGSFRRAPVTQLASTLLIGAAGFGAGYMTRDLVAGISKDNGYTSGGIAAAAGAGGIAVSRALANRSIRAGGWLGAASAIVGATGVAMVAAQATSQFGLDITGAVDDVAPGGRSVAVALEGAAAIGAGALALRVAHALPNRPSAIKAARGALAVDEALLKSIDPKAAQTALESRLAVAREGLVAAGGGADDAAWERIGSPGRRFLSDIAEASEINQVMKTDSARQPIRIYVGLHEADTMAERVAIALDRAEKSGAIDRGTILAIQPVATGRINPVVPLSAEFMTHGDIASIAVQTSGSSALLAMRSRGEAAQAHRMLVDGLRARAMERGGSANVIDHGLCFGGWVANRGLAPSGVEGFAEHGVSALYLGIPGLAKSPRRIIKAAARNGDPRVLFANGREQLMAASRSGAKPHVTYVVQDDDPLRLTWRAFIERPATRGGSRDTPFVPIVSALNELVDIPAQAVRARGGFYEVGHDYRRVAPAAVRAAFHFKTSDTQLAAIEHQVAVREAQYLRAREALTSAH